MYKTLLTCAVLACACAQQNNGDIDSIINQIFGKPNQTTLNPVTQHPGGQVDPSDGDRIVGPSTIVPPGISDITNDTSCTTEKGEIGECVRYYLCDGNNSVITDGIGIIDIRVRDGPCPSYLDSCCLLPDRRHPDNPITPAPPTDDNDKIIPGGHQGCGYRNPEGVGMRTKGDTDGEAKFGEFPWTVAILKIEPVNENDPQGQKLNVYVGGGSLIHPNVVLTAAHYVTSANELRVRAGEWDTQTVKEIYPYQDRDVAKIEVHKDFNKGNLFYDVALLFLAKPFDPAPNVGVVCLPRAGERALGGTRCFASGWGKDKFGKEGRYQVILKKVEVPVVDRRPCLEALRKTRLGTHFELHTSFMCAGGEAEKDTCKGDGGSPLVCPIERTVANSEKESCKWDGGSPLVCPIEFEDNRFVQNGIVAWGIGCGENGTPGVYVDVAKVRDWIDDKVKGQGYQIAGYQYTI